MNIHHSLIYYIQKLLNKQHNNLLCLICVVLGLCELGWLYKKVDDYITKVETASSRGLIAQAFGFSLQEELSDYYRLLTVLEGELVRTAQEILDRESKALEEEKNGKKQEEKLDENEEEHSDSIPGLSLMRLRAWMSEPIERMCLLARLVDTAGTLAGGALASRMHSHGMHGDTSVTTIVSR